MIHIKSLKIYILCYLLIISPIYFVWAKFPEIVAKNEEKAEEQIIKIGMMGALPFVGFVIYRSVSYLVALQGN
jgi:hypothetical protein